MKLLAVGIACGGLLSAGPAVRAETVYKWIDDKGVTHYGQRPPAHTPKAQRLDLAGDRPPSATATPGYEERLERINRRLQVLDEERRLKEEQEAEARQAKARRDQQCARLRARVAEYRTRGGTWYEVDKQGDRRYLDEREMAERIRQLDKAIGEHCR